MGTAGNTAAGASNAAVNLDTIDADRNKLQLIIKEQANGGMNLTAKNVGTAVIDLAGYEFSLSGHLLLRPTEVETRGTITGELQPGESKSIPSEKRFASACANFTHYTATARNKTTSQQYEARLDVPPLSVSMKPIKLGLRSAKLSDLSVVTVVLEVTNTSSRIVRSFAGLLNQTPFI